MKINIDVIDGLAVVDFLNPPVNALSVANGFVGKLTTSIHETLQRRDVDALMLKTQGRIFSAGADIAEFDGSPEKLNRIRELNNLVETAQKPIIACLHGVVLGGGLELALACHYRIAAPATRLGLPEVKLGLLPGGGGTQRLPRLVGPLHALRMMLSGDIIDTSTALEWGVLDGLYHDDPEKLVRDFIMRGVRPTSQISCSVLPLDFISTELNRRTGKKTQSKAPDYIAQCVEVSVTQSFEQGLKVEQNLFDKLLKSDVSLGLRHTFFGQRTVSKIPNLQQGGQGVDINSVAVIGGGLMGTGIAIALLNADLPLILIDRSADVLETAKQRISQAFDKAVQRGRVDLETANKRLALLGMSQNIEDVSEADLIIEAVFEKMEVKKSVFEALDRVAKPGAILASNTSTLDLDVIAGFTKRPESVVGLHFFSPANIMKLLEIIRGKGTRDNVLAASLVFAKRVNKIGVIAGNCDGFIGNRMFEEYLRQAYFLLEEGALPEQVDSALEKWGMAMGPLKTMDLAGQDIGFDIRARRKIEQPDRPYSRIPDIICEMERYGQKTGAGFYLYPDGRKAIVDPEINSIIVAYSKSIKMKRRDITDDEIIDRCIGALINEGANILDEKIAYRSVDIDMIWLNGYGFPRERGGPMFYADRVGPQTIAGRMREFAKGPNGWAMQPTSFLSEIAQEGKKFGQVHNG